MSRPKESYGDVRKLCMQTSTRERVSGLGELMQGPRPCVNYGVMMRRLVVRTLSIWKVSIRLRVRHVMCVLSRQCLGETPTRLAMLSVRQLPGGSGSDTLTSLLYGDGVAVRTRHDDAMSDWNITMHYSRKQCAGRQIGRAHV